ncbi:MAG: tetratricopeptide repeat protein [Chryseobacterium sp.]|uniref:tetratricopeptide repeat protein n=1 Tax=Chryseobacterium sp. TaxID=1871047 RepID=UPI0025C0F247|nr:tetratricopeptide repeat protein [Chryseobacterium sp.]MCJ7934077.1 tetratricopeptide repeat protein [Chryseobacterium sp.]
MKSLYIITLMLCSSLFLSQKVDKLFSEERFTDIIALEHESPNFSGQELYQLGFAFFRAENDDKAIEYYDKALKKGFDNPIVFFQKGLSEMYLKKYDEALKNISKAIEAAPLAEFYYEKYRILYTREDYINAEKTFLEALNKSVKKDKWYVEMVMAAGNFYYTRKDFAKSETIYRDGIAEFPKEYELYTKLIKALNAQNKFSEADIYFDKMKVFYENKELSEDEMKFKNLAVDEFEWKNQWINVHKYFVKPKNTLEGLYILYLIDKKGEKVERKFKIEKTLQLGKTDPEFVICEEIKDGHTTYPIGFKDDRFTLESLRREIVKVLDNA